MGCTPEIITDFVKWARFDEYIKCNQMFTEALIRLSCLNGPLPYFSDENYIYKMSHCTLIKHIHFKYWERREKDILQAENILFKVYCILILEKHQCERKTQIGCLPHTHTPQLGQSLQPGHVPWPGIQLANFQLWDDAPTNWVTQARARLKIF